jgi:hypothetical protein
MSFGAPAGNQPRPPEGMPTNAFPNKGTISMQEMLLSGPPQLKMHSLAMISNGSIKDDIDESYLPGLKACSEDASAPIRGIAARVLGEHFVKNQEHPNPDAMELLGKLANDDAADVQFNAVYYGLTQVKYKTPELVEQLIDIASTNRKESLQDQIIVSLANYQPQAAEILDKKLTGENAIAYYEIYEEFTGKVPTNAEKFQNMPSSRPRMFIFKAKGDAQTSKTELEKELRGAGLENPTVRISGKDENYSLLVKTYLTKDYKAVEKAFSNNTEFRIIQSMWLTPELEVMLERMK